MYNIRVIRSAFRRFLSRSIVAKINASEIFSSEILLYVIAQKIEDLIRFAAEA
jgi:hypothetical protein